MNSASHLSRLLKCSKKSKFLRNLPDELRYSTVYVCDENSFLLVSGLGLNTGPPNSYASRLSQTFVHGLMTLSHADNEIKNSNWLNSNKIDCKEPLLHEKLSLQECNTLGFTKLPKRIILENLEPSILISKMRSPYIVKDDPHIFTAWLKNFLTLSQETNKRRAFSKFSLRLAKNINKYQCLGAYNDGLTSDSINLAGEFIELSRFMIPEEIRNNKISAQIFQERQKNEAYAFINIVLDLAEMLQLEISIREIILDINFEKNLLQESEFSKELKNLG